MTFPRSLSSTAYFTHIQITERNCSLLLFAFGTSEENIKHKPVMGWLKTFNFHRYFYNMWICKDQKDELFYTLRWACTVDGTHFLVAGDINGKLY